MSQFHNDPANSSNTFSNQQTRTPKVHEIIAVHTYAQLLGIPNDKLKDINFLMEHIAKGIMTEEQMKTLPNDFLDGICNYYDQLQDYGVINNVNKINKMNQSIDDEKRSQPNKLSLRELNTFNDRENRRTDLLKKRYGNKSRHRSVSPNPTPSTQRNVSNNVNIRFRNMNLTPLHKFSGQLIYTNQKENCKVKPGDIVTANFMVENTGSVGWTQNNNVKIVNPIDTYYDTQLQYLSNIKFAPIKSKHTGMITIEIKAPMLCRKHKVIFELLSGPDPTAVFGPKLIVQFETINIQNMNMNEMNDMKEQFKQMQQYIQHQMQQMSHQMQVMPRQIQQVPNQMPHMTPTQPNSNYGGHIYHTYHDKGISINNNYNQQNPPNSSNEIEKARCLDCVNQSIKLEYDPLQMHRFSHNRLKYRICCQLPSHDGCKFTQEIAVNTDLANIIRDMKTHNFVP